MNHINLQNPRAAHRSQSTRSRISFGPLFLRFMSALLLASCIAIGVVAAHIDWQELDQLAHQLPTIDSSDEMVVFLKDQEGRPLQARDLARDQMLNIKALPKHVINAFIASEDATFFRHCGINPIALIRAFVTNIKARRYEQGASTITQQVARISYLTPDKSLWRKIHEVALALMIERYHSKETILTRYLHHVFLGQGAYGVEEAAWVYFGKKAGDLSVGEAALIAGLAPAPSRYNPLLDQATALKRRDIVLDRMVKTKAITQQQALAARTEQIYFAAKKPHLDPAYAFLQQQVLNEINGSLAIRGKEATQLRVTTSIDVNWQRAAAKWDRFIQEPYIAACRGQCESAFVAIQAKSGQLLGFTGSRDFRRSQFNRAVKMKRAMGQMILPFVIGASFDNGGHWLQTFGVKMNPQQPQSAQNQIEPTLMDALRGRLHAESMRLLYLNGVGTWQHFVNRFSQMWQTSSMNSALGLETVSPIGMARLYAGLMTAHEFGEMTVVREISNASGKQVFERSREMAPEVIPYHVRRLLSEGLRQNMALAATNGRRSVGGYSGYIGYSPNSHDLWAVFVTQDVVAVGWLGDERGRHRLTQEALSLESYHTIDRLWLDFAAKLPHGNGQINYPNSTNAARDIAMVSYTTIWGESMRVPELVRLVRQSDHGVGAEIISR